MTASHTGAAHLFQLDELFRGTNTTERIAAAEATLVELTSAPASHIVVAATHDTELSPLLGDAFAVMHLADREVDGNLVFDYRLAAGPSTTRNALALLERHGAPRAMIERALALAQRLEGRRNA